MPFQFPNPLPTDAAELADLRAEALEAFKELQPAEGAAPTPEELDALRDIVEGIEAVDTAIEDITGAQERTEEAARLAESLNPTAEEENGEEEPPADEHDDEEPAIDAASEQEQEPAAVAASGKRRGTSFSAAASGKAPAIPKQEAGFRLNSNAVNYEPGVVDSFRVAKEFNAIAHGRAARIVGNGGRSESTVASIERQFPDKAIIRQDGTNAAEALDFAADEKRLPGGSLVAAGGWCAPSDTSYDFLPTQPATGLLSLPEVSAPRGGLKFPVEPDFSTIYNEIGFSQTEAQAIAEEEKDCFHIPCADFEEVRLGVEGICITAGILQDKAWPELTEKYVNEAMRIHQHKVNARRINDIVSKSTAVDGFTGLIGTAGAVLNTLELQVQDMRSKHRLAYGQSLEGMAPEWLRAVIRADLAYRDGVLPEQVTDAIIDQHFRDRGVNLQFVQDWQADVIGGATPATAWPSTVQVALWVAGTFSAAVEPVISLGVVYDMAMLKVNKRVQMFTEDGIAIIKRGLDSRVLTIPLDVNGMVGLRGPVAETTP